MKSPCKHPGCPQLVIGSGYCQAHQREIDAPRREYDRRRRLDPSLALAAKIRSSSRWRNVRKKKLAISPLCEDPYGDHKRIDATVPGQQVHHVEGLAVAPSRAYDMENLMTVCTACHSKLEAEVR